jgi:hypothetical protein
LGSIRTQIGLIALVLLVSAAAIYFGSSVASSMMGTIGGLLRVGLVMAALWLALPQLNFIFSRTPKWLLVATVIAAVMVAIRPAIILYAGAALVLLWLFGPRLATKADPTIVPRRPRRKE